jgi:hypothetical protein
MVEGKQRAEIAAHLDACPDCMAESMRYVRVMALVSSLEPVQPPIGLWNGVYHRISAQADAPASLSPRGILPLHRHFRRWQVGLATAVLAVGFALAYTHIPVQQARSSYNAAAFVHGHVAYSSQDILADQVALGSAAALADREEAAAD